MTAQTLRIGCWVVVAALTAACDDLLEVTPTETLPPEVATGDVEGVQAVLLGVYERFQLEDLYNSDMLILPEVLADNGRTSTPPQQLQGPAVNQIGSHLGGWAPRYQSINEANYVIESAPQLTNADEEVRNRLEGEALFLRGLHYFDLARIYAYEPNREVDGWDTGVVLRTTPTRTIADVEPRARATVTEVYEQIEADLLRAIDLLAASGNDDVYFANRAAAEGLLARVYLYWQRWSDAAEYATAAMANTTARLGEPSEFVEMFSEQPNLESLFEITFTQFDQNYVNYCMACYVHPDGTWFAIWPPQELVDLFEAGDVRALPRTADGIPYPEKWTESAGDLMDNIPVIRYAELLLIRAEAHAELGQEAAARADLLTLRQNRGVGPIDASGPALIRAILDERRRELAFEGHRWFDLKRRGLDVPKPAHSGLPALPYTDFRILAALPSTEVQNNDRLVQNPGY